MAAIRAHPDFHDACLHSINLMGLIVLDVKRNIKLHIICIGAPLEVMTAYDVSEGQCVDRE